MRRANRVEPGDAGSEAGDITRATVTTTTRMEFVRRVEVVPMKDAVAQLHTDLNQSLGGNVTISPRMWTGMNRLPTPLPIRRSRRPLWLVGCLFMTVGLLALIAVVVGLTFAFGKLNPVGGSDIERYDVGDLHYGMKGVSNKQISSNTTLSEENKAAVQRYLSEQLANEPGFRGLVIDEVIVQGPLTNRTRQPRQTSCSTVFIIRNIRIYFDRCPACTDSRNLALLRALSNITALQQPLNLTISNGTASRISTQICSTPNITGPILPVRLSLLQAQELNSNLSLMNSTVRTTGRQRSFSTPSYSSPASARSSHVFTPRVVPSRKTPSTITTTTTTTAFPLTEATSSAMTTVSDSVSTVLSTIPSDSSTESTFTSELASSTIDSDIVSSTVSEAIEDTTLEAFTVTISTMTEDTAQTFASSSEQMTTVAEELDSSTSVDYTGATSSSFASITITEELDQTSTDDNTSPSAASVATETISHDTNPTTESLDTSSEHTSTTESTTDEFIGSTSSPANDLTSTTGIEELASVSSEEPFTSTSSYDDVTESLGTSTSLDSMTSDYTSTTETEITTSDVSVIDSSTTSTYLDETSFSPTSPPITVRPRTTYVPTTSRVKLPINNRSRPTPGKIIPILPLQPLQPTVSMRNASFTVATIKLDRTRKSTWYSTGTASVTKSRYGPSKAVTSLTMYQTKPVPGRRGNTTVTPPMTTARTSLRFESTGTTRRGRFRGSVATFKQTTPVATTTRRQTTIVTYPQTSVRESSTFLPFMSSESTTATLVDLESSSTEIDTSTDLPVSTDDSSSTALDETENSTEPLLIVDLTSTDNTHETSSSDLSAETTPIVSASRMHNPLKSLDVRDNHRRLPLTSSASAVVASLESSSFTTIDLSDILSLLSTTMLQGEQSLRFMANSTPLSDPPFHTETDTTVDATEIESSSRFSDFAPFKEITSIDRIPSTMTSLPTTEHSGHLMAFSSVTEQTSETTTVSTWPLTPSPMAFNDDFQTHISSQVSRSHYATSHPFNTLSLPVDDMQMTPSIVVHSFALDKTGVKPWINAVSEDQEVIHPLSSEAHLSTRKRNSFSLNSADTEINYITSTSAARSAVESSSGDVSNIRTITPSTGMKSNIPTTISSVSPA